MSKRLPVVFRDVDVCPVCGAWASIRKTRNGKSVVDDRTGCRRIYAACARCGASVVVQYRPPELDARC